MPEEKENDKTILYFAFGAGLLYLVYSIVDWFKPFGKEELERKIKEVLNDIKYEKDNLGELPASEINEKITYYKTEVYTKWNFVKSLGFTMSPSPSEFESQWSTEPAEEQALAWKMYEYNLLSKEGQIRYNDPMLDLAKTLGLALIIGAVAYASIKKVIEEWRKPKPPNAGTIAVSGNPDGATAKLSNGEITQGVAPVDFDVTAGSYLLEVLISGYATYRTLVDVVADVTKFVNYTLTPLPSNYVRFITPAGSPYGNVNELWFDVYRATKQVSFWEAGVFVSLISISPDYLDWIYENNREASAYSFEVYYGHTYEYYYPPPQETATEKYLNDDTWSLIETLILTVLGTIAVYIFYAASMGRGVPVGSMFFIPTKFSGLKSFLEANFSKQYVFVVRG